ncbi:deoxyguanosinetriphosphate triphosphohydrolase (plasmid) [Nostoc sp. NIES-2111]|nr:deoxyguanosinetriphosphate triphosphohydrolase [Nostoc sp. NIES-2111]
MRAKAISKLIDQVVEIFLDNESKILTGEFDEDILSLSDYRNHLEKINKKTRNAVFEHRDVVSIQIAGYEVLGKIFTEFANSILSNDKKMQLIYHLLPKEYHPKDEKDIYEKILKITDYVSGMTDSYATSLFQELSGISLGTS